MYNLMHKKLHQMKFFARILVRGRNLILLALFCIIGLTMDYLLNPLIVHAEISEVAQTIQPPPVELQTIKAYIEEQTFTNESERIDFVRNWVNQNSIHLIDQDHDRYAFNTPKVLAKLWNTHLTGQAPAHLSCGPRALAMKAILDELGIANQLIMIFTDNYAEVRSHTFLEVYNRETHRWEMQDPDFNLYYIDVSSAQRVTTAQLINGDLERIVPVSPQAHGWQANNVIHLKQDYFEAMMYMNHRSGRKSILLINLDRFEPEKVFSQNADLTFFEFADKHYKQPTYFMIAINGQELVLEDGLLP